MKRIFLLLIMKNQFNILNYSRQHRDCLLLGECLIAPLEDKIDNKVIFNTINFTYFSWVERPEELDRLFLVIVNRVDLVYQLEKLNIGRIFNDYLNLSYLNSVLELFKNK